VLVAGGDDGPENIATDELYNPGTGTWSKTGKMMKLRLTGLLTIGTIVADKRGSHTVLLRGMPQCGMFLTLDWSSAGPEVAFWSETSVRVKDVEANPPFVREFHCLNRWHHGCYDELELRISHQ
jgi:hypothetical protein